VSILIVVVDSTTVVNSSVIGSLRMVGGGGVIAEMVGIHQVLVGIQQMLEMGRNGLMYISVVVPAGDVLGIGGGEVESCFILEISLVVGWLFVVEEEVCCVVVVGSNKIDRV